MGLWCLAWASDGMGLGRRELWWVVGDLDKIEYPSKLVCRVTLDRLW